MQRFGVSCEKDANSEMASAAASAAPPSPPRSAQQGSPAKGGRKTLAVTFADDPGIPVRRAVASRTAIDKYVRVKKTAFAAAQQTSFVAAPTRGGAVVAVPTAGPRKLSSAMSFHRGAKRKGAAATPVGMPR